MIKDKFNVDKLTSASFLSGWSLRASFLNAFLISRLSAFWGKTWSFSKPKTFRYHRLSSSQMLDTSEEKIETWIYSLSCIITGPNQLTTQTATLWFFNTDSHSVSLWSKKDALPQTSLSDLQLKVIRVRIRVSKVLVLLYRMIALDKVNLLIKVSTFAYFCFCFHFLLSGQHQMLAGLCNMQLSVALFEWIYKQGNTETRRTQVLDRFARLKS